VIRHCGGISAAILCLMLTVCGSMLSACGSTPESPPGPEAVQDADISASLEMARFAFLSGRYDQAVRAYSGSLERAYARDDVAAIGVAGQELAFSYLRAGKPNEAVQAASRTREELARRGRPDRPALALVEATARYRLKETAVAERLAREVAGAPDDPMAAARATFLLGLIAADRRDVAALTAASDTLSRSGEQPEMKADSLHLTGRLHLIRKDYVQAAALPATNRASRGRWHWRRNRRRGTARRRRQPTSGSAPAGAPPRKATPRRHPASATPNPWRGIPDSRRLPTKRAGCV
jgi:hypothetical protein